MTKKWTYHEGKALIYVYGKRKHEYSKTRKKKRFWENILSDLEALNALVTPTTTKHVEVKWQCLYRTYKNAKNRGTGTGASKFLYLSEMEAIFRSDPLLLSPQAETKTKEEVKTKHKKEYMAIVKIKRKYYEDKLEINKKKLKLLEDYITKKEEDRAETHSTLLNLLNKLN